MNDNDIPSTPARRTDADEIARLLPAPGRWDLPHEQHLHHKELLMQRIDRDQTSEGHQASRRHDQASRPPRRLLRPAVLLPVTAVALSGILAAGIALTAPDGKPATRATDTVRPATALLNQISAAALKGDALPVRDDQFTYTRAKSREADITSGKAVVGPLKDRETWWSQKQGPLHKLGLAKADGETLPINAELGDTDGTPAGINRPTYRWLAALPTDPDKLLTYLYAKTPKVDEQERDQAVFDRIGDLVGEVMPPETAAALYRAAAALPGVTEAPKAHDAIGRHGVGIAREDTTYGTRTEWIFDRQDLTFLGSRSYLTKDTSYGKSGTLLSSNAVIEHAVVDKAGAEPTDPPRTTARSQES
ncbi:CU044_5270 family protein [Streptomyces sp. NPDC058175]|uniref:CU044_5270 family protein n=1 Tax=Streptomyces sp. NPDC058175 TaxID=3346367 RepID=UPI0036EE2E07